MAVLTIEQKQEYEDRGILVVETGVPHQVIDTLLKDLKGKYPEHPSSDGVWPHTRIQDAWRFSEAAHRIAVAKPILDALAELYGREPLPFQTLNFPTGTNQWPHADSIHFNSCPPTFMAGAWVALEDIGIDQGPLIYYPGSHKLPEYTLADLGLPPKQEHYAEYEAFIQKLIAHHNLKPTYGVIKKGQAILWSSNVLHGGMPRKNPKSTRHSQVTHFYFEGCKYFTPMYTRGLDVFWRNPEWIPKDVESIVHSAAQPAATSTRGTMTIESRTPPHSD